MTDEREAAANSASTVAAKSVGLILVCGSGHSGTSLITAMLGSHPRIFAINFETRVFARNDDPEGVNAFLAEWRLEAARARCDYLCEKTPAHIFRLPLIREVDPAAPIIVPIRDPRDVALSFKKRMDSLEKGIVHWKSANALVRKRAEQVGDLLTFRYEDLIGDPLRTLERICEAIGLEFSDAMLQFHEDEREWFRATERRETAGAHGADHRDLRNWQIHQPIMDNRGKWRAGLTSEEVGQVESECAGLMAYFGYEPA